MFIFDSILLLILAGFVFYGLFYGLIRAVGSLVSIIFAVWLASEWYLIFYEWAHNLFFGYETIGKIISFIIIFVLINRLLGFAFVLLDKAFKIMSIIPFLKTINRLAGAVLGFIEGGIILGLSLYSILQYSLLKGLLGKFLAGSQLAPFLIKFAQALTPILPTFLKQIEPIIK